MSAQPFWRTKTLAQLNAEEWEALCDGCGLCCLQKLEDEETGEIYYTDLACQYLDHDTCRCKDYPNRLKNVPMCMSLTVEEKEAFTWLPPTCAYRLMSESKPLLDWHPLISGDPNSVHNSGISVQRKVVDERKVPEEDWEDHIIHWVG